MSTDVEKLRLHFIYCAIILGLVIVAIATDRWTAQQNFTEYLSNAATMTSLVLGLVAIFYSFISNDGMSRSLGNINNVSSQVGQVRDEIADFVKLTEQATTATRSSAGQMQGLSDKVERDLAALTQTLLTSARNPAG
jgi:GTP1/Obg family GTP-binding protein